MPTENDRYIAPHKQRRAQRYNQQHAKGNKRESLVSQLTELQTETAPEADISDVSGSSPVGTPKDTSVSAAKRAAFEAAKAQVHAKNGGRSIVVGTPPR